MIKNVIISFSAVQIYDLSSIYLELKEILKVSRINYTAAFFSRRELIGLIKSWSPLYNPFTIVLDTYEVVVLRRDSHLWKLGPGVYGASKGITTPVDVTWPNYVPQTQAPNKMQDEWRFFYCLDCKPVKIYYLNDNRP